MTGSDPRHFLVTGGAGYVGSALIPHLLLRGDWVTVIDRLLYGAEGCLAHVDHPHYKLLAMDFCDPEAGQEVQRHCAEAGVPDLDAVVHLGAAVGHQVCRTLGRVETFRLNVEGAERMYRLAQQLGAGRFIFASTCSVYGRTASEVLDEDGVLKPVSDYGQSKVEAEKALLKLAAHADCELLIFRLATVFGLSPRMRFDVLVNQLVRQAHRDGRVVLFHPDHWRPFVHMQDVMQAFLTALDSTTLDQCPLILNLGSERNCVTKRALAAELAQVMTDLTIEVSDESLVPPDQDVRVEFSRFEATFGLKAARTLHQGIAEMLSALRQGWFPALPERYLNRLPASYMAVGG